MIYKNRLLDHSPRVLRALFNRGDQSGLLRRGPNVGRRFLNARALGKLAFIAAIFGATSALNAATVTLSGTVSGVTGPAAFQSQVPVSIGDAFSATLTMSSTPTAITGTSTTIYSGAITNITGQVGGYSFSMNTSGFPGEVSYRDDFGGVDRIAASVAVEGVNVLDFSPDTLAYRVLDQTGTVLSGESYDTSYFDQPFIDSLANLPLGAFGQDQYQALSFLIFRRPAIPSTGFITIDLEPSATQIAPVPLPASGLLLIGGLAIAGAVARRSRKQNA